ncbi:MAG: hypothetical protein RLZZ293_722 [Pseudomonadota bacterium]|jgi:acyl dehydratase
MLIKNVTYDEITVGMSATIKKTIEERDIYLFGLVSGDLNPAHFDAEYAQTTRFGKCIAHGMISAGFFSTLLGTQLPGPGTIYLGQSLSFQKPVYIGETLEVTVTVSEKLAKGRVILDCKCTDSHGDVVTSGSATVLAPRESMQFNNLRIQPNL